MTITDASTVSGNTATGGGGLYAGNGSTVTITDASTVSDNTAGNGGGFLRNRQRGDDRWQQGTRQSAIISAAAFMRQRQHGDDHRRLHRLRQHGGYRRRPLCGLAAR